MGSIFTCFRLSFFSPQTHRNISLSVYSSEFPLVESKDFSLYNYVTRIPASSNVGSNFSPEKTLRSSQIGTPWPSNEQQSWKISPRKKIFPISTDSLFKTNFQSLWIKCCHVLSVTTEHPSGPDRDGEGIEGPGGAPPPGQSWKWPPQHCRHSNTSAWRCVSGAVHHPEELFPGVSGSCDLSQDS